VIENTVYVSNDHQYIATTHKSTAINIENQLQRSCSGERRAKDAKRSIGSGTADRLYMTTSRNIAALGSIMDVLYAKLLVVVGIAVPVTISLNRRVPVAPDQITSDIGEPYIRLHLRSASCIVPVYRLSIRWRGNKLKAI